MDYVYLAWLALFPCKTLLQSIWPYTEEGVATQVWNYMLQCLPMFKTAVVICLFNCLIALEVKCHPRNGSNFINTSMLTSVNNNDILRAQWDITCLYPKALSQSVLLL